MSDANVALFKRWFEEVWNQRRHETIRELVSPDCISHGVSDTGGDLRGADEFEVFFNRIVAAFPDIRIVVEDCFVSGDKVVGRYAVTMTHTGDYIGLQASGKTAMATGISIIRVANGKFVESWDVWDKLAMLSQIGAIQFVTERAETAGAA
jgi:steroid delta-isomerase-like uncharacterized protein